MKKNALSQWIVKAVCCALTLSLVSCEMNKQEKKKAPVKKEQSKSTQKSGSSTKKSSSY